MSKTKRQIILVRISATPFNSGTLDNIVLPLMEEAKAKAKSLILVLTDASNIEQFNTQVEASEALVAPIQQELPTTFRLEVAYYLASKCLLASIQAHGGKALAVRSDDGGLIAFGKKPSVDVKALMALMASGYTIVVIPPICTQPPVAAVSIDSFTRLLARQLDTSIIEY